MYLWFALCDARVHASCAASSLVCTCGLRFAAASLRSLCHRWMWTAPPKALVRGIRLINFLNGIIGPRLRDRTATAPPCATQRTYARTSHASLTRPATRPAKPPPTPAGSRLPCKGLTVRYLCTVVECRARMGSQSSQVTSETTENRQPT